MTGRLLFCAVSQRPLRFSLSLAGVMATTLLVLALFGTLRGVDVSVLRYVGQPGVDLWVAPKGSDNLVRASGLLGPEQVDAVRGAPGVEQADPILRSFVSVRNPARPADRPLNLLAIGFRTLGGPPRLVSGSRPCLGEVTLDRVTAGRLRATIGDVVEVGGRRFHVAGITTDTNWISTQLLFCNYDELAGLVGVEGRASFLALRTSGSDPALVLTQRAASIEVIGRSEFIRNNLRETTAGMLPILWLIAGLGAVVAALIVALLVQGLVEDRRADLAVLLAMGTPLPRLALALVLQGTRMAALGGGGALVVAAAAERLLDRFAPALQLSLARDDVLWTLAALLMVSALAAALPVIRLSRVEPMEAFRA